MKRIFILLFLSGMFSFNSVQADHIMGGEITWDCVKSGTQAGKYVFHLVLYRDCNGIAHTGNATISVVNYPSPLSITMYNKEDLDVTPNCDDTTSFVEESCGAGPPYAGFGGTGAGAIQRSTYRSDTISLSGTPPANGWIFIWNSCCRNALVDNFPNPLSTAFTLRAVMYPYTPPGAGTPNTANTCYDSSPSFKEDPALVICTGDTFNYNHNANDVEFDSLAYHVGYPLTSYSSFNTWTFDPNNALASQNPTPYFPNTGYPMSNLYLPDTSLGNSLASMDVNSGEILVQNFQAGSYVMVVKVEAWRCGQLISLIYRDLQIVYLNCGTTLDGEPFDNNPPTVTFQNQGTSSFTKIGAFTWADTVVAGFPVNFQFNGVDSDTVNSNTPYCGGVSPCPQLLNLEASGAWYGTNYSSSTAGCPQPPCATLNPAPPFQGISFLGTNFSWDTSCDHLSYSSAGCSNSNTYTFLIKLRDNMCPAPSFRYGTFVITVLPGPAIGPDLKCVSVLPSGNHEIQWIPPAPADTGINFDMYYIYHSFVQGGPYTLVDSVLDYSTTNYVFNTTGGPSFYYITVKGGCDYISPPSDTIRTIELNVQSLSSGSVAELTWNATKTPPLSSSAYYYIYREYPAGNWTLIDSTNNLAYFDTISICNSPINYQVGLLDTVANCISYSTIDGDLFGDLTPPPIDIMDSVSVDLTTGLATMGWPQSTEPDAVSYILYILDPTGAWLPIDTIFDITQTNYTYSGSMASDYSETFAIATLDSCDNRSPISPLHRTMNLQADIDLCLQEVALSWGTYAGWPVQEYNIVYTENGGPKNILATVGPTDSSYVHNGLTSGSTYCYYIQAVSMSGELSSSNEQCILATIPVWPTFQYMPVVTVNNNLTWVEMQLFIDDLADVIEYRFERGFSDVGPFSPVVSEPKPVSGQLIDTEDNTQLYAQQSLYYRVIAVDSCGYDAWVGDTIHTIYLEINSVGDMKNELSWNAYEGWPTGVDQYDIWRSVGGAPGIMVHSHTPTTPGPYIFIDDLNQSLNPGEGGGDICYLIDASENPGNPYGLPGATSYSNLSCVSEEPLIYIPSSFTPNGDGLNEVFLPSLIFASNLPYEMFIYDRWGKQLFYSNSISEGWDGTYDGNLQEQGTYVYFIQFVTVEGEEMKYRGTLTLIK